MVTLSTAAMKVSLRGSSVGSSSVLLASPVGIGGMSSEFCWNLVRGLGGLAGAGRDGCTVLEVSPVRIFAKAMILA